MRRHETRCLRQEDIDWDAPPQVGAQHQKAEVGRTVLKMENLKKYYEVAASALFKGGEKKVVKANETLTFEARESETLAIVGESGCGKSTFAKVLMGLETATEGRILLDNREIQHTPIEKRDTKTVADVQMVFQNPFDTLNPSMTVGRQIMRALEVFGVGSDRGRAARADADPVGPGQAAARVRRPDAAPAVRRAEASAWASRGPLRAMRASSWRMSPSRPWTSRCRPPSPTC